MHLRGFVAMNTTMNISVIFSDTRFGSVFTTFIFHSLKHYENVQFPRSSLNVIITEELLKNVLTKPL